MEENTMMSADNAVVENTTEGFANPNPTEEIINPQPDVQENISDVDKGQVDDANKSVATETLDNSDDITRTQSFSKRLKQEVQKEKDKFYAEHYSEYGIKSEADYLEAMERQKYIEEGKDPELYQRLDKLEKENQQYQKQETISKQEQELRNDPIKGELFTKWESDIKTLSNDFEVDLNTAFLLQLEKNLGDVLTNTKSQAEQEAVQKLIKNESSSVGSLSQSADNKPKSYSKMSKDEFEALTKKVLRGELK